MGKAHDRVALSYRLDDKRAAASRLYGIGQGVLGAIGRLHSGLAAGRGHDVGVQGLLGHEAVGQFPYLDLVDAQHSVRGEQLKGVEPLDPGELHFSAHGIGKIHRLKDFHLPREDLGDEFLGNGRQQVFDG